MSCGSLCRTFSLPSGSRAVTEGRPARQQPIAALFSLVAEERHHTAQVLAPCSWLADGEQVRARSLTHKQPGFAGQAAHLADRRLDSCSWTPGGWFWIRTVGAAGRRP